MNWKAIAMAGALALAVPAWAADDLESGTPNVKVGDTPPDYVGTDFDDKPVKLSDYRGKVVVLTFFATWCGPCRHEMSVLDKIQSAAGTSGLQIVSVNFKEDGFIWRRLKRDLKDLTLKVTRDKDWSVVKGYAVASLPRMFMIDRTGHVAYSHLGYGDEALDGMLKEINDLLTRPAVY